MKYIDFLSEVRENSLESYQNQSYQLETLVEKLNLTRELSRNALFDVMFNMSNSINTEDLNLDNITLSQSTLKVI